MKIVKPDLNYADIFQDDVGTEEGFVSAWINLYSLAFW